MTVTWSYCDILVKASMGCFIFVRRVCPAKMEILGSKKRCGDGPCGKILGFNITAKIMTIGGNMQQLITMLELQNSMNAKVHPQWQEQSFEWYRAIWIECGELLDHYGWKWWKKQSPDIEQVKLELIDIWHFGLSIMLQSGASAKTISEQIIAELVIETDEEDFRLDLEAFAAAVLSTKQFDIRGFGRLMAGMGLSLNELYTGYVGKNVLNFFRQDHGYQDGSYRKIWGGREDNEHLVDVMAKLDSQSASFKDDVYAALAERYQSITA